MVKEGPLSSLTIQPLPVCTLCLEKNDHKAFFGKSNRSKGVLELIHTDVCGPLNVRARGGFDYFITLIDDYSRYGSVYVLHRKSKTFKKFKEYWLEAEKQLDKNIKSLRSERCGEYVSGDFDKYLLDNRILS